MNKKNDSIKDNRKPGTFLKTNAYADVNGEKVSFSFENFNASSVVNDKIKYNSYYKNIESSRNAVSDFFDTIKELSRYEIGQLMSDVSIKKKFHLMRIDRDEHIDRIEIILKECYGYPQKKIDEFYREYYEFQISDGKRVIWYKLDNKICPLFIDSNHLVCIDSTRNPKCKMRYSIPSSFSHLGESELSLHDKKIVSFLKEIIEEFESDNTLSTIDIIDLIKDVCNEN